MGTQSKSNSKDTNSYFDKFLLMSHQDENQKLSTKNPILVQKDLREILGKKSFFKARALRSGLLLIEVDQKQVHDKVLHIKKLYNNDVNVKAHPTLNLCKGTIYCEAAPPVGWGSSPCWVEV